MFAGWEFTSRAISSRWRSSAGDFVYADPPYDVEFTQYSQGGFGWDEQVRAAEWLAGHTRAGRAVNQATPRITKLYSTSATG